jgi:hypothetical protein
MRLTFESAILMQSDQLTKWSDELTTDQVLHSQQNMEGTLRLRGRNGRLLILTAMMLMLYVATFELLFRAIEPNTTLGIPSVGSNHKGFEARLNEFEHNAANRRAIDCVFLGDSTTQTNFAPYIFAELFQEQSGKNIECFNFGVGAFTMADSAVLAQILVQEHAPKLIIIGVEALNFTVPADEPGEADLTELAWTKYKLGHFTIEGWLYEHSALYRHLDTIRQLITLQVSPTEMRRLTAEASYTHDGFYPIDKPSPFDIDFPPDPNSEHPYPEHYFAALTDYQLLPEQLAALNKIVALNGSSTQVILVEMPVPPTFFYFFGNGEQDYRGFIEAVERAVSGTNVPFWRTTDLALLPAPLWFNYNHLNATGAPIFSQWLANRLEQAITEGTVRFVADGEESKSNIWK